SIIRERAISLLTSVRLRWARVRESGAGSVPLANAGPLLHKIEECWNEEDVHAARRQHAADYGRAHDSACHGTGAGCHPQRYATENERKRGHQNGTQAEPCPFK